MKNKMKLSMTDVQGHMSKGKWGSMKFLTVFGLLVAGLVGTTTIAVAQESPQIVWEMDAAATNLTFSADGATMYTGGRNSVAPYHYGNIKKWDVLSKTEVYTLTSGGTGVIGRTNALAVTPDGTGFASGHGRVVCPPEGPCKEIAIGFQVWNAASGTSQFALEAGDIDGLVESVAFSRDGEFVAFVMTGSNQEQIRVYDYPEYTLQGTYDGHGDGTYCAAFSPTDNLLATGGSDGLVRLWDVETHQLVRTLVHGSYTNGGTPISVAFSADGSRLAVSGRGYALNATVWDVSSGNLVYSLPAGAGKYGTSSATVAFSPNGSYLVAGVSRYVSPEWGGLIRIWDMDDGSLAREYMEETVGSVGSSLFVAVSPAAEDWIAYTYDDQVKFAETGLDLGGTDDSLLIDTSTLSAGTGGTVNFTLDAGSAYAFRSYFLLGTVSGTSPGFPLPGGTTLPLNWDSFTTLILNQAANSPFLVDFLGTLDEEGQAAAQLNTFGPFDPSSVGMMMHFAFTLYAPLDFVSIAVEIEIVE